MRDGLSVRGPLSRGFGPYRSPRRSRRRLNRTDPEMAWRGSDRSSSVLPATAALALLALTVVAGFRLVQRPALWELAILTAAWTTVLVVALRLRRRALRAPQEEPGEPAVTPAAGPPPAHEAPVPATQEELLSFTEDVLGSVHGDRLRATIAQRLPQLVGIRHVWVVAQFGARRQVITPGGEEGETALPMLSDTPRDWATFPMTVDREVVGVLGAALPPRPLTVRHRHLLGTVAAILARALKNSDEFEAMREASTLDTLTGCLRRPEGLRRLEAELRRAQRFGRPVAALLLDLDHFKSINDRFGHACGDAMLAAVGGIMTRALRSSDLRCRWGGEEFLIALPESSVGPATRVAESLRRRIADVTMRWGPHDVSTSASFGVAIARPGETDIQRLVARADAALYQAKSAGRNCVKVVLGDLRGTPIGLAPDAPGAQPAAAVPTEPPQPPPGLPFPDRRHPSRRDRRRVPSPGRRRTDPHLASAHRSPHGPN